MGGTMMAGKYLAVAVIAALLAVITAYGTTRRPSYTTRRPTTTHAPPTLRATPGPPARFGECSPNYSTKYEDYYKKTKADSWEDCAHMCYHDAGCMYWSWNHGNSGTVVSNKHSCYFHSASQTKLKKEKWNAISGRRDCLLSHGTGKTFKISPKAWNGEGKKGQEKMIGFGFKWKQNTATPKLVALTVNGIPYTCIEGDITSDTSDTSSNLPPPEVEAVVAEEDEVRPSRPSGSTTT